MAGSGFALAEGAFRGLPALAALIGALLIQIATNLANDYYDFVKGSDTAARLGPVRVTQAGLLSPRAVVRAMVATLALATLVGVYLAWVGGWPILAIGIVSMVMGVCYTGGPYPLAYHGLGDLFVFIFFGPVATAATHFVQAGHWSPGAILAGAGLGALSTAILAVNNLRDRETDDAAGKRTLAVRFGDRFAVTQYLVLLAAATLALPIGLRTFGWSPWTLLALTALIPSLPAAGRVLSVLTPAGVEPDRRALNPALGMTARGVALYGAGLGLGAALAALLANGGSL